MSEIPGISSGLFPDGLLGIKGWRRNQSIIEQYAEMLGAPAVESALEAQGQAGSVGLLVEHARRASTRAEQTPYMTALAQIVDSAGVFEADQELAAQQDEAVMGSLIDAQSFLGAEQQQELLQLADGMYRASLKREFDPDGASADVDTIANELRTLTRTAGDRLNTQFLSPLNEYRMNAAGTVQTIKREAGEDRWNELMPNHLVTQALELAGASLAQSEDGKWSFKILGMGYAPDQVPEMTYAQGLALIEDNVRGREQLVNGELERRGAPQLQATQQRLANVPSPAARSSADSSGSQLGNDVRSALADALGIQGDTPTERVKSANAFVERGIDYVFGDGFSGRANSWLEQNIAGARESAASLARTVRERRQARLKRASNVD